MATIAEMQAQLEKLDAAIASGTLRVEHGDTAHTYQSTEQMLKARANLERRIAAASGTRSRLRYAYQIDKGL